MTGCNHTPARLVRGPIRVNRFPTTRRPRDAGEAAASPPGVERVGPQARGPRSRDEGSGRLPGLGLDCSGSAPAPSRAGSCGGPAPAYALRRRLTQWGGVGGRPRLPFRSLVRDSRQLEKQPRVGAKRKTPHHPLLTSTQRKGGSRRYEGLGEQQWGRERKCHPLQSGW